MVKVAITGVESTGKTSLCKQLAQHYKTTYLQEQARAYLEALNMPYTIKDIENICALHKQEEAKLNHKPLLFLDTEMYTLKIWCEVKYNFCPLSILNACNYQNYDAYIIPDIDLPWEADALREHPSLKDRQMLQKMYVEHIANTNKPWIVISGNAQERLRNSVAFIERLIV